MLFRIYLKGKSYITAYLLNHFWYPFTSITMCGEVLITLGNNVAKYFAMCYPLKFIDKEPKYFIILAYIFSIILNFPKFFETSVNTNDLIDTVTLCNLSFMQKIKLYLLWTEILLLVGIPIIIMLFLNMKILLELCSSIKETKRQILFNSE